MRVPVAPQPREEESAISSHNSQPAIPTPESFCTNRSLTKHIVPAGHGYAFPVKKGTRFRIVDLHGEQVVDLMAWATPDDTPPIFPVLPLEKMSPAYTRYHLRGVTPTIGEHLYSNADRPLLRVTADTVKVHDMTYMACFPSLYTSLPPTSASPSPQSQSQSQLPSLPLLHRSCAQNIFDAMKPHGMEDILQVPEPFNCFQNTPNYSLKAMGSSKPGDYVEFEALVGVLVAVSCCPYDVGGFNGGKITDVAVVVSEERE